MKKLVIGMTAMAGLMVAGQQAMANEVQLVFNSLLVDGRGYDAAGVPINRPASNLPGGAQTLTPNVYMGTDGKVDSYDVGRVASMIDWTAGTTLFTDGTSPYELTFVVSGADDVLFQPLVPGTTLSYLYSLGLAISLYLDTTPDYSPTTGAGASDGILVLQAEARDEYLGPNNTNPFDLKELYDFGNNTYSGTALLDVTGGLWAQYWDTNQRASGSDIELVFGLNPLQGGTQFNLTGWNLSGSGSAIGNPVPEPASMLLFGAGLAGLAGLRRRRNK